jgi:hypothetical protein
MRNSPEERRSEPRVLIERGTEWSPNCFGRFGKETSLLSLPGIERRSLERQSVHRLRYPGEFVALVCTASDPWNSEGYLTAIHQVLWC